MRVLFVLSREVMFFHGSGEVEAKLLQVGIQLLGIECDIAGLDSVDFKDYDAYFLFSIRADVIELLDRIPAGRPCVIIPQSDECNEVDSLNAIDRIAESQNIYMLSRSSQEHENFVSRFGNMVIRADGWFLKPFIHEEKLLSEIVQLQGGYQLCMVSADRDEGLSDYADKCEQQRKRLYVVSDRPEEHLERLGCYNMVTVKKRAPYGSVEWYQLLDGCDEFFEPVPRLTSSLLEAIWMGKKIVSPHADYLVEQLGRKYFQFPGGQNELESQMVCLSERRKAVYRYHANFVAAEMIRAFGGFKNV